jgi:hypothetical protein
MYRG